MGGQTVLRDIPERTHFGEVQFDFDVTSGEKLRFFRASAGGNFKVQNLLDEASEGKVLKKLHKHDKTDNVAGFYLEKIGLLGKRILRSKKKGTTQSLSFRNLAKFAIVQEGEIQQTGSPFWGGHYTRRTAELATIKFLLTGVDDSNFPAVRWHGPCHGLLSFFINRHIPPPDGMGNVFYDAVGYPDRKSWEQSNINQMNRYADTFIYPLDSFVHTSGNI